jgi:hypothetical protein
LFFFAVRAGTGGDEAGIWAGDLVGRLPIEYDLLPSFQNIRLFRKLIYLSKKVNILERR